MLVPYHVVLKFLSRYTLRVLLHYEFHDALAPFLLALKEEKENLLWRSLSHRLASWTIATFIVLMSFSQVLNVFPLPFASPSILQLYNMITIKEV